MRLRCLLPVPILLAGCTFEHDLHRAAVEAQTPDASVTPWMPPPPQAPPWTGAELITPTDTYADIAIDSSTIYWLERTGKLRSIPKAGGAVSEIMNPSPWTESWSNGLIADDDGLAFILNTPVDYQLWLTGSGGAHPRLVMSMEHYPSLASMAFAKSDLYISTFGKIARVHRSSAAVHTFVDAYYGDIWIDGDNLYTMGGGGPKSNDDPWGTCVVRLPLSGGNPENVFCGLLFTRLFVNNGSLIANVNHANVLHSLDKIVLADGTTTNLMGAEGAHGIFLAVHGNFIYAAVNAGSAPPYVTMIKCVPLDGGLVRTIAGGPGATTSMVVDADGVYFDGTDGSTLGIRRAELCN